ncbi:MATE family efflux transporter [Bradyrhizobium sp. 2TAF24]|uniref:MATE family efflux transporter n=1 Tax=Bradyrhizobium sp. 2TAF24 TaxID=3233011 RepID=UPI003F927ABD
MTRVETISAAGPPRFRHGAAPAGRLLQAPVLPTLLRLSVPNAVSLCAVTAISIAETGYVGRLGTDALAAIALVLPVFMLLQMMAIGAMGGGITAAVARALGAGDTARATALVRHAVVIAGCAGLTFTLVIIGFGRPIFHWLGGDGAVLDAALAYARVAFAAAGAIWLTNALASVLRGTGDMIVPSATFVGIALLQITVGGALGLGLGPLPRLGMAGVACGVLVAYTTAAIGLALYLASGRARLRFDWRLAPLDPRLFGEILRVGAPACLAACQAIGALLVLAHLAAQLSTDALAGYGIGARLELLMMPLTFAFGVSATPMVGAAIGAGDVARARRAAWTAGLLGFGATGLLGLIVAAVPSLWVALFSDDAAVVVAANTYLHLAGPAFAGFGLAHCLYYASQGSGRIVPMVLAQSFRLLVVVAGTMWITRAGLSLSRLVLLAAAGLLAYGLGAIVAMSTSRWDARP